MAENQAAYQRYMDTGYNAAWEKDWDTAIDAFSRALHASPDDPESHIQLGVSLYEAGRLEDSLKILSRANKLAPDDPIPLERSANVLEQMGHKKEAAQQYVKVAEIYEGLQDRRKAIDNWEQATQLSPGLIAIHAKLGHNYERSGNKKKAIYQYLVMGYHLDRLNEKDKATKSIKRALKIDRRNSQALNMLRALQSGGNVRMPTAEYDDKVASTGSQALPLSPLSAPVEEANPLGPMGEAMETAMMALADFVMQTGELTSAGGDALQALQFQRQNIHDEAITAYQRAESKLRHPALKLNLGALLLLNDEPDEAIKHLGEAIMDPQLSAGALHALGQAYYQVGKYKQAARHLTQSLQAVDTNLTTNQHDIAALTETYGQLLSALGSWSDDSLAEINERFVDLLQGTSWKQSIPGMRRFLENEMRDAGEIDEQALREALDPHLASAVTRIDSYMRQGLLVLAMDEAHSLVEVSPHYLPAHTAMAEILVREGRLRHAIAKYNTIASAYMAREEIHQAAIILQDVLEMAPLDISLRTNLISLLESENRMDEVLDQYSELAKTYNQLGNFDKSRETFQQAEQLARRIEASPEKLAEIKHSLADMDQMRLDTRHAIRTYEEIVGLVPEDVRAYRMLVELNYSMANQVEAIKYLDVLLGIYARNKQISKIVHLLEELIKVHDRDPGLRSRLSAIYKQLGRKNDAIEQLDILGELQLEEGLNDEACNTIRQIIALEPDNLDDYQQLLGRLGC